MHGRDWLRRRWLQEVVQPRLDDRAILHEFLSMYAGGDEDCIDTGPLRAGQVGTHQVADRYDRAARNVGIAQPLRHHVRGIVGAGVGLAAPEHLSAHLLVDVGNGAGTKVQRAADVDHLVRVGADELEPMAERFFEQRAISLFCLVDVVDEPVQMIASAAGSGTDLPGSALNNALSRAAGPIVNSF